MKTLRRYDVRPATYFLTVVTFERKPLLYKDLSLFAPSWALVKPVAWVIMPDHFHVLVSCGAHSVSEIVYRFKLAYRYAFESRFGRGRIWQNRFWDHIIRNGEDFARHLDYIHFNPVHHGIVGSPADYAHSSFRSWLDQGYYDEGWCISRREDLDSEYGE